MTGILLGLLVRSEAHKSRVEYLQYERDRSVADAEALDVVKQTGAAVLAALVQFPDETGRVDHGAEEDRRGNVSEQPKNHHLHAQSERLLFL